MKKKHTLTLMSLCAFLSLLNMSTQGGTERPKYCYSDDCWEKSSTTDCPTCCNDAYSDTNDKNLCRNFCCN